MPNDVEDLHFAKTSLVHPGHSLRTGKLTAVHPKRFVQLRNRPPIHLPGLNLHPNVLPRQHSNRAQPLPMVNNVNNWSNHFDNNNFDC